MHIIELNVSKLKLHQIDAACRDLGRLQSQLRGQPVKVELEDLGRATRNHHLFVARTETRHALDEARSHPKFVPYGDPTYMEYVIYGMAILIRVEKLSRRIGLVEDVVVDESRRGQGLGRLLMEALIQRASELGLTSLKLTSRPTREAAHALYQKLGFERYDTDHFRLNLPPRGA